MSESKEELKKEDEVAEMDAGQSSEEESKNETEQRDLSKYEDLGAEDLRKILAERDEELQQLQEEQAELKDARLRKVAELDNYRKRVKRERSLVHEKAKANALRDFLEVNDDLQRTLEAAEDLDVNETFLEGVLMVSNKFKEVLDKNDVQRIDQEGVPFNVDFHDAMMRRKPEDDSIESDMVLNIVESGYRMGDRTIRHAKVIVSE